MKYDTQRPNENTTTFVDEFDNWYPDSNDQFIDILNKNLKRLKTLTDVLPCNEKFGCTFCVQRVIRGTNY